MNQQLCWALQDYHRICLHSWNWDYSPCWFWFHAQFECTYFFNQRTGELTKILAVLVFTNQVLSIFQVSDWPGIPKASLYIVLDQANCCWHVQESEYMEISKIKTYNKYSNCIRQLWRIYSIIHPVLVLRKFGDKIICIVTYITKLKISFLSLHHFLS